MPKEQDSWWLIFERTPQAETRVASSGGFGGFFEESPKRRGFAPVLITQAKDWNDALSNAIEETGRLGEFAAVECEAFIPDLINKERTDGTEGTDK
jgi:hypothetical protein